jgi:hypothetical protein
VTAADGNDHASDSYRHGIAAERALMKRFDRHAFVEAEVAQTTRTAGIEQIPINPFDSGANADLEGFKGRFRHIAIDYQ